MATPVPPNKAETVAHELTRAFVGRTGIEMPAAALIKAAAEYIVAAGGELHGAWSLAHHNFANQSAGVITLYIGMLAEEADPMERAKRLRSQAARLDGDASYFDREAIYRRDAAEQQRERGMLAQADDNQEAADRNDRLRDGKVALAAKYRAEADEIEAGQFLASTGLLDPALTPALRTVFGRSVERAGFFEALADRNVLHGPYATWPSQAEKIAEHFGEGGIGVIAGLHAAAQAVVEAEVAA